MNRLTVESIIELVEELAPLHLAQEWDHCGLQLGDTSSSVERVMISLDITREVLDQALAEGVQLLISHHPLFFLPLQVLNLNTLRGQIIKKALEGGVSIYTAHTNLDNCRGGINDYLASLFDLRKTRPIQVTSRQQLFKLVIFIPPNYLEDVRDAISSAGAGWIGHYSHSTFQMEGEGTFKPLDGSQPFIGHRGRVERVKEVRLETIIPCKRRDQVIEAMLDVHPYEEVAYDIYPLESEGPPLGPGRWGHLREPLPLKSLIEKTKEIFSLDSVDLIGDDHLNKTIERVALCGGSGGDLMDEVVKTGVQIYITGDLKYHQLQKALENQVSILSVSHPVTEKVGLLSLENHLLRQGQERGYNFDVLMAEENFPVRRL